MASAAPIGGGFHFRESVRVLATIIRLGLDQESIEREVTAVLVHAVLAQRHRASTELARSTPRDGADRHLTDTRHAAHSPADSLTRAAVAMRGATAEGGADQMNLSDAGSAVTPAASIGVDVRPPNYRLSMRYLMLMWAEADAAGGDESDLQAWVDFDEQVKANGAFVLNGALAPASTEARLVQTAIAGHALDGAVQRRPYAEGKRQIEAFYIMDLPDMDTALEWANRLPTYGHVEVRELLQF